MSRTTVLATTLIILLSFIVIGCVGNEKTYVTIGIKPDVGGYGSSVDFRQYTAAGNGIYYYVFDYTDATNEISGQVSNIHKTDTQIIVSGTLYFNIKDYSKAPKNVRITLSAIKEKGNNMTPLGTTARKDEVIIDLQGKYGQFSIPFESYLKLN